MKKYSTLTNLFDSYFHQDWDLDFPDELSVLREYASTTWLEDVEQACIEINSFLEENSKELKKSVDETFSPMIEVGQTDSEVKKWFIWLKGNLQELSTCSPRKKQK